MDELRKGINLRAYANTKPIDAYKQEGFDMFENMIAAIQTDTVRRIFTVRIRQNEEVKRERVARESGDNVGGDDSVKKEPRKVKKVGRNDPCPCGSGLKYKKCCGRNEK
ncbi:Protein translocase subunit SecA [bioreactor metagenome]|uniref:Protein translocase subunit SecA n=1 Tax=bioreactor metagenome TaxID=1076179 RepID=A0A645JP76_9ZZZZ